MSIFNSKPISTDNLVFAYDSANIKSYKGPPIQNKLLSLTTQSLGSSTYYDATAGEETVYIPTVGETTAKYVLVKNDYNGGSGNCCPSFFGYGNGIPVTGSTLYTYGILYRTTSGYTNGNFMYHYEYNSTGGYLTEYGLHDDNKRIHLGGGWYWAWNTFTSNASAATFNCSYFYYKYSNLAYDKLSVAKVMLVQGDYSGLHPKYWPAVNTTRSSGQVVADLTGVETATVNRLTYNADGSPKFVNSSNDSISIANNLGLLSQYTVLYWCKRTQEGKMAFAANTGTPFYAYGNNSWFYTHGGVTGEYYYPSNVSIPVNTWGMWCITYDGTKVSVYRNGVLEGTQNTTGVADWQTCGIKIGGWGGSASYAFDGEIPIVKFYKTALTPTEIAQEFNIYRSRYGV